MIDAIEGAGWLGLFLLVIVASRVLPGIRWSTHPFTPYCVGIIVANLFSGGLFRSTSLWFALAFLISEGKVARRNAMNAGEIRPAGELEARATTAAEPSLDPATRT